MEDKAREIAKSLYGDNYNHSQYEKILHCLQDFKKFMESLNENLKDLKEFLKQE